MKSTALSSRHRKLALWIVATAFVATLVVGLLHLPFAKPLLAALSGRGGGCPMGMERAETLTPAQVEERRAKMLASTRGGAKAAGRPALGFALDGTTRPEIEAWIAKNALTCNADRHNAGLICDKVPAEALPAPGLLKGPSRVLLGFDVGGRLVSVNVNSTFQDADSAARAAADIGQGLDRAAGPAAKRAGEATADYLSRTSLAQSRAEWHFVDYDARVAATNMGSLFLVDVVFQTVPDAG